MWAIPELKTDIYHLGYTYDDAGNITAINDTATGQTADTQCFRYDYQQRIAEAWTPKTLECATNPTTTALAGPAPYWRSYTYDAVGDRKTEVQRAAATTITRTSTFPAASAIPGTKPHAATQIVDTDAANKVLKTQQYAYDKVGNTLCRPVGATANTCATDGLSGNTEAQLLTFNDEDHLAKSKDKNGETSYLYDADGNRLVRRDPTGTTLYLTSGQEIRLPKTGPATGTRYYTACGQTVAVRTPTGVTMMVNDHHGTASATVTTDANLTVTRRRTMPFGETRGTAPTTWAHDKGFLGGTQDNTGLTHLGAREYDPTIGRFISVDPVMDTAQPQQWAAYTYANNNPTTLSDPSGLWPKDPDLDDRYGHPKPGTGKKPHPVNGGSNDNTDDLVNTNVEVSDVTKTGLYVRGYGSGTFRLGELLEFASISTDNWIYLCTSLSGKASTECEQNNPTRPNYTAAQEFGMAGIIFAVYAAGYLCGAFIEVCVGVAGGMLRDEGEFAATGNMIGSPAGVYNAGKMLGKFCSFSGDTPVLMADGKAKEIQDVKDGDLVLATDPETGKQGPRTVSHLWVHNDNLVELSIAGHKMVTTRNHPFWNASKKTWEPADKLRTGDKLLDPQGRLIRVDRNRVTSTHRGAAYNLTVDDIHTYYVLAGNTPVLVHNTCVEEDLFRIEGHVLPRHTPGGALNAGKSTFNQGVDLLALAQRTTTQIGRRQAGTGRIEYVMDAGKGNTIGKDVNGVDTTVYTVIRTGGREVYDSDFLEFGDLVTMHPGTP